MVKTITGFILRIIDNKDVGKILIIYSRELGRITAFAYIPEKINSVVLSTYEIGNAVEAVIYKKKEDEPYRISQINLIKQYPGIRFDYDKYNVLIHVLKTLLNHTEENLPDKDLMNFLKLYINFVDKTKEKVDEKIVFLFNFYFLRLQGLLGDFIYKTEEEKFFIDTLKNQVLLDEKLYPYITKNMIKQVLIWMKNIDG